MFKKLQNVNFNLIGLKKFELLEAIDTCLFGYFVQKIEVKYTFWVEI